MKQQEAIKEYLLGALSDEAQRRGIEEKILLHDDFNEQLLIAEDELIDEYLAGDLADAENESFNRFFLITQERKQRLRLIRNLRKYAMQSETQIVKQSSPEKTGRFNWRELFSSPSVRLAATAVLLIIVGVVVWRVAFYESDVDKGLAQLRAAYSGQRPTESRSTAGFAYAPLIVTRGSEPVLGDKKARERAYVDLFAAADDSTDAKAHHALGLYYLAEKQFDNALNEFNTALKFAPNDAKLQNDIGAVYLEKAKQAAAESGEVMENLARALQFVNRALEIDSLLLEALFNKALILQKMPQLTNQAREAWEEYLKKDSTSPWADEARKNLEELKQQDRAPKDKSQILQDFLDAFHNKDDARAWEIVSQTKELITGVMVQQQLAQKFLEASQQSRKEEADEILSAFLYLGELEKQNVGDLYFSELADYYSKANQIQRQKLLEANNKLQEGNGLIKDTKFEPSLEILYQAKELFISAGNVWEAQLAEHRICYSLTRIDRIKESNERLLALSEFCRRKSYKWLQTMTDIWIAESYFFLGEFSKAILYNQKSLKLAQETFDTYNTHRVLVQLTEVYRITGDYRNALLYTYKNLILRESYHTVPRQKWRDLNYSTEVLQRLKFYDAAIAFGKEAIGCALNEAKDDWMITISHRNLAIVYADLQKFEEAYHQIETNFQVSQTLKSEALRKRLFANSTQILGDIQRQTADCSSAIENYNKAIQTYRDMEISIFEYSARKGKFLCNLAQKNDAGVKEEFGEILQYFEEERRNLKTEGERIAFFDVEQNVYDAAIDYAYSNLKDKPRAFDYAENSRARSLLNSIQAGSGSSRSLSSTEIWERIAPDVQMVYYAVLKDKILIWYVSNTKFTAFENPINAEELENKVSDYLEILVKNDGKTLSEGAKELYEILIKPIERLLEKDKSLCIVADKSLFRLPFSSIVSPETNRHLIEDYTILFAPSATVFINETELAGQKADNRNETILSIGNPSFSREEHSKLANLPSSKREAVEIASFYAPPPKIFTGKEAVKEQIVSNLNEADVIHFAGHYVSNNASPALSKFLLTASDLSAEEIMQKQLSRPRLMILSACDTGVEKFYNGEGMIGAARAFLASNVPLVVASQWSVDSDATAELMIKFHRYRKLQGLTTIAALRQAQIDMLSDEKSRFREPFYWAGFLPIGGYANY